MPCRFVDDLGGFVGGERIGKVPKPPLRVSPECAPALVRNGDKAFSNIYGIHRAIVVDHHRLFGRLGVEDPHVGSNPTPSATKSRFFGAFLWLSLRQKARVALESRAFLLFLLSYIIL